MEREDFINALDAIARIREKIMSDCGSRTGLHSDTIATVRLELDTIKSLENTREQLVKLRDYLLLYPEDYFEDKYEEMCNRAGCELGL